MTPPSSGASPSEAASPPEPGAPVARRGTVPPPSTAVPPSLGIEDPYDHQARQEVIIPSYEGLRGPGVVGVVILLVMVAFVLAFFLWASFSALVVSIRTNGQVIPHSQVQTVENLEGGILAALLVDAGDVVIAGEVLARIDDTVISSSFRGDVIRYLANVAAVDRLSAEMEGRSSIRFSDDLATPTLVDAATALQIRDEEEAVFRRRTVEFRSTLSRMGAEVSRITEQLTGLEQQVRNLTEQRGLTQELLTISTAQAEKGLTSNTEVLKLRRQVSEINGKLGELDLRLKSLTGDLTATRARISEFRNQRLSRNQSDLQATRVERDALSENLNALGDRVRRREVRSPVNGIVQRLLITTIGGVLAPGEPIMEIVPVDDDLLIAARIRPSDRADLRAGMEAFVRITAYDASVYNSLPGLVERVSADTLFDANTGVNYFEMIVRVDESRITLEQLRETPIRPGMEAQIDVVTGERTILEYILKPVLKLRERALREP